MNHSKNAVEEFIGHFKSGGGGNQLKGFYLLVYHLWKTAICIIVFMTIYGHNVYVFVCLFSAQTINTQLYHPQRILPDL